VRNLGRAWIDRSCSAFRNNPVRIRKLLEINANNGKKFDLVFCVFTSLLLYLLFGLTDYIFNSPKQIILFFILMGLTQAISQCYDKTLINSPESLVKAAEKNYKEIVELKK
jgi:hypothetical protein